MRSWWSWWRWSCASCSPSTSAPPALKLLGARTGAMTLAPSLGLCELLSLLQARVGPFGIGAGALALGAAVARRAPRAGPRCARLGSCGLTTMWVASRCLPAVQPFCTGVAVSVADFPDLFSCFSGVSELGCTVAEAAPQPWPAARQRHVARARAPGGAPAGSRATTCRSCAGPRWLR